MSKKIGILLFVLFILPYSSRSEDDFFGKIKVELKGKNTLAVYKFSSTGGFSKEIIKLNPKRFPSIVECLLAPDQKKVALIGGDDSVWLFDIETKHEKNIFKYTDGNPKDFYLTFGGKELGWKENGSRLFFMLMGGLEEDEDGPGGLEGYFFDVDKNAITHLSRQDMIKDVALGPVLKLPDGSQVYKERPYAQFFYFTQKNPVTNEKKCFYDRLGLLESFDFSSNNQKMLMEITGLVAHGGGNTGRAQIFELDIAKAIKIGLGPIPVYDGWDHKFLDYSKVVRQVSPPGRTGEYQRPQYSPSGNHVAFLQALTPNVTLPSILEIWVDTAAVYTFEGIIDEYYWLGENSILLLSRGNFVIFDVNQKKVLNKGSLDKT